MQNRGNIMFIIYGFLLYFVIMFIAMVLAEPYSIEYKDNPVKYKLRSKNND